MSVSPLAAGWGCKCPECGEGPLFSGYLEMNKTCPNCGADFTIADSGDGPAFFVMSIVPVLLIPLAMVVQILFHPPSWVHLIIWPPAILGLSMYLLRPFKATLFALQWKHKAEEARFEDRD